MTNAELAKQIKEFAEKLDRYYANQEETINKYDDKIVHLHNELEELAERVNGLGIAAQETTRRQNEQVDRLDRYRDVQDKQFAAYDSKIKQQSTSISYLEAKSREAQAVFDKLTEAYSNLNGRLGDYKSQLNDKLESIEQRLNSMDDTTAYVRQVAEESKKIEDALKVSTRKLDLFSQKNLELMERNKRLSEQNVQLQEEIKTANKMCDNVSKKASKLADRVQKLEADSIRTLRLSDLVWQHEDKLAKVSKLDDRMQQLETAQKQLRISVISTYGIPEKAKTEESMEYLKKFTDVKKDIIFSEFNAGKRAIVFSDSDYLEKDYLEFCREFVKWQEKKTKEENLYFKCVNFFEYLRPFLKQPTIYDNREPFVIWLDTHNDGYTSDFQYGTLQSTWREHHTVGGLPYTEWSV